MMEFKAFHSVKATIYDIETAHMIRKGHLSDVNISGLKDFMALAGGTVSIDKCGFVLNEYLRQNQFIYLPPKGQ